MVPGTRVRQGYPEVAAKASHRPDNPALGARTAGILRRFRHCFGVSRPGVVMRRWSVATSGPAVLIGVDFQRCAPINRGAQSTDPGIAGIRPNTGCARIEIESPRGP